MDKKKQIESGYPRKTNERWKNMPILFDTIFTLNILLVNDKDESPTYVISGDKTYYLDPISDTLKNEKSFNERFKGLQITN